MIEVKNLAGGYTNKPIIKGLNFSITKGEFFALLGPNGSGKTTLFKLITGQLPIQEGSITIAQKSISAMSKLEKAKKVAVLTQEVNVSFDYTVEEIVSLGRYPHQKGLFKSLSKTDRDMINHVMRISRVEALRDAQFRTISGGEKQRVLLAKALVQEPDVLLLDEPTNHLDIKHTFQMLDQLKHWQVTKNLTIFAILHDLNVASLYADRMALLHEGDFLEVGDANLLRNVEQLKTVYEVDVITQTHPTVPKPQILMTPSHKEIGTRQRLHHLYCVKQAEDSIYLQFARPMRTISNAHFGSGFQWLEHFLLMHSSSSLTNDRHEEIQERMKQLSIPLGQALCTVTKGKTVQILMDKRINDEDYVVVVIAELAPSGNGESLLGNVHMCVFVDKFLRDKEMLDAYMAATEAKTDALQKLQRRSNSNSHDTLAMAGMQNASPIQEDKSEVLLSGIKTVVHEAIQLVFIEIGKQPEFQVIK